MQENANCCCEQKKQKQVTIVTTQTIVHLYLEVLSVKYFHDIPKSICNINQAKQDLRKHPICLTDSDQYYIFEEIELREIFSLKGIEVMMVMKNISYLFVSFFIPYIELFYMIFLNIYMTCSRIR